MNVTLKDEKGDEKKEVAESITISPEPITPAPQVIQELTSEVKHLRDEIVELKQQSQPTPKPAETKQENSHPQQVEPTVTEEQKSEPPKLSEGSKSFFNVLFGVIGKLIMFLSKGLFYIFNLLFSFIKTILDMLLDILVAIDFTGVLADLFDRKDKV